MSPAAIPCPVPAARTARRITWPHLPAALRTAIEARCGSAVADARSMGAGFTPGFASVLTCEDGSTHFVKAASAAAQRQHADAYRIEAAKLAALPHGVPAPRLLWAIDSDWVVLGIEHVAGRNPARPWRPAHLDSALDALETVAEVLTPAPTDVAPDPLADDLAPLVPLWGRVSDLVLDLGGSAATAAEAASLAAGVLDVCAGDTVVHTDLRDDNVLLTSSGAVLCDWNFPVHGAAWVDTVMMLIGPRGDGLDVEQVLAARRLTRDVDPEHVDRLIVTLTGYFLAAAEQPVPPTSPHLRAHQRWQGEVCWAWLSQRRGWA